MDTTKLKHPDPILHRYLLLCEREAALSRGEQIAKFPVDNRNETAFSQLLDRKGARRIAFDLVEREYAALAVERESIARDAANAIGVTLEQAKGFKDGNLERLLTLYEWKQISAKDPSDPVWREPFPWRDAAGFGEQA
jgi:hypothetical protein